MSTRARTRISQHVVTEAFSAVLDPVDHKPCFFGLAGRPVGIIDWKDGIPTYVTEPRYPTYVFRQGHIGDIFAALGELVRVNRLGRD